MHTGRGPMSQYRRHEPERTLLYQIVAAELEGLRESLTAKLHGGLPKHVDKELEAYLRCGILAHGFARVVCSRCRFEHLVAFSCKGAASARRAAECFVRPHVIELSAPVVACALLRGQRRRDERLDLDADVGMHPLMAAVVLRAAGTVGEILDLYRPPSARVEAKGCPLSDWIAAGSPYLENNASNELRTVSVVVSGTARSSKTKRLKASRTVSGSQRAPSPVRHQPLKSTVHRSFGASTSGLGATVA